MKPAEEWLNEVGETVANDMFSPDSGKPGDRTLALIKNIQVDAMATNSPYAINWMLAELIRLNPAGEIHYRKVARRPNQ